MGCSGASPANSGGCNESSNITPWEAWQALPPSTWQKAVKYLALQIAEDQRDTSSEYRLLNDYFEGIRRKDPKAKHLLDGSLVGAWADAVEVGALIGYALARTQPSVLEEFEDWPRRALELAGLPVPETSEDDDPSD